MTFTELALMLGLTPNQLYMWHQRRATSGFPEAIGSMIYNPKGGRRRAPFFDVTEVVDWYVGYDPDANRGVHWAQKRASDAQKGVQERRTA